MSYHCNLEVLIGLFPFVCYAAFLVLLLGFGSKQTFLAHESKELTTIACHVTTMWSCFMTSSSLSIMQLFQTCLFFSFILSHNGQSFLWAQGLIVIACHIFAIQKFFLTSCTFLEVVHCSLLLGLQNLQEPFGSLLLLYSQYVVEQLYNQCMAYVGAVMHFSQSIIFA